MELVSLHTWGQEDERKPSLTSSRPPGPKYEGLRHVTHCELPCLSSCGLHLSLTYKKLADGMIECMKLSARECGLELSCMMRNVQRTMYSKDVDVFILVGKIHV